ncbi:hypothetical protein DFH11DRAFT_1728891 [Phellopilus nigrolimitatus]|nr:hypothetical protein DFH11DRAFT_1728891 [Phellopilus nigrolimitatus]
MLSRLAARGTRRCTYAHGGRRVLSDDAGKPALGWIVEKRLKTVRSSLNVDHQEPPSADDLAEWRHVVQVRDIHEAIANGGGALPAAPSWVLLYLLSTKVQTPVQAMDAVRLMLESFPHADAASKPALLILTARFLARHQTALPMPNLVKAFLMLNLARSSTQFNLLLRAMSHFRSTPELAKLTARILGAMRARQIRLHSRSYRSLLSNELVTLELAKTLQHRMHRDGFTPNAAHLEAYLRVFAKHGAVHASARYLNLIRTARLRAGQPPPHGVHLSARGAHAEISSDSVNTRWNTEFLASFGRHTGSAFHYLRDLVGEGTGPAQPLPLPHTQGRKISRVPHAARKTAPVIWKRGLHVSDWSTVLHVAARDPHTSSEQLLDLFTRMQAAARFPLTVGVCTVLMRGLVKKGDYPAAHAVWERCNRSYHRRRRIDAKALTVAVDVLVGVGQPLVAFDTLIETAGLLRDESPIAVSTAVGARRRAQRNLYSHRAHVDTVLVNALMDAFLKHGRPDVVFRLWDACAPLFGVAPNAESLTVLLKAAREAARFDHTFRGLMEHMGLHGLFSRARTAPPDSGAKGKAQLTQSLRAFIAKDARRGAEPADADVRALFRAIVLGNFPRLRGVRPPARAVWSDEAQTAQPVRDALRSLGLVRRDGGDGSSAAEPEEPVAPAPFLVGPALAVRASPHPQISPNEKTFAAYIALLGASGRASEVAEALAWMRTLGLALALWSEASVRGPLVEHYAPAGASEYGRLYSWLVGWLGAERMPTEAAVNWAFRCLKREREK